MSSASEVIQRMAHVEALLAKRYTPLQIERICVEEWDISPKEARDLIRATRDYIAAQPVPHREERKEAIRQSLHELYRLALEKDKLKDARNLLKDLITLDALNDPEGPLPPIGVPPVQIHNNYLPQPNTAPMLDLRDKIRELESGVKHDYGNPQFEAADDET